MALPAIYLLGTLGAAAFGLLSSGCSKQSQAGTKSPKPAQPLPRPQTKLPKAKPPQPLHFNKSDLEYSDPSQADSFCGGNYYYDLLSKLSFQISLSKEESIVPGAFFQELIQDPCYQKFAEDPKRTQLAKKFVRHMATFDEQEDSLSPFDYLYGVYFLIGQQWGESWPEFLEFGRVGLNPPEQLRLIGKQILDSQGKPKVAGRAREMLASLASYTRDLGEKNRFAGATPLLNFYLKGEGNPVVSDYIKISIGEFLKSEKSQRIQILDSAIERGLPEKEVANHLMPYLLPKEVQHFIQECFKKDLIAALNLFEGVRRPRFVLGGAYSSGESKFYPNLPQDTPFEMRQKAIDAFLGDPVLTMEKKFGKGQWVVSTTVKKYLWIGDTEVFSIESGKPGPTTFVFAPHFHEPNPRKFFHWTKDIPLQSGRIILMPEANRYLGLNRGPTNPMNGLFNEALLWDRMDFLIIRRVEYLMGLVDGMIGVHDSGGGPFYISDEIHYPHNSADKNQTHPGPTPSPYVSKKVRAVNNICSSASCDSRFDLTPQVQWQIANAARKDLKRLTGRDYYFRGEHIQSEKSHSADSATGYMNFHLGKPAMTFEGNKGGKHGQLHAMSIYTLLLAFGHKIHRGYERQLKNPQPKIEPELFVGLPPDDLPEL